MVTPCRCESKGFSKVPTPNLSDNILDNIVEVLDSPSTPEERNCHMAECERSEIFEQNRGRLLSAGASAHEHFVNYGKILDYAYEADRKMVSLVESLGVRESTSKSGHLGMPIAGSAGA